LNAGGRLEASEPEETDSLGGLIAAQTRPVITPIIPESVEVTTYEAIGAAFSVTATHYGEAYNGSPLACGGVYSSGDPSIVAVSLRLQGELPCGAFMQVCGVLGCIVAQRQDTCPGCVRTLIDLSEAGIAAVCGVNTSTCAVTVQKMVERVALEEAPQYIQYESQYAGYEHH
jgi:hypothetical protein